MSLKVFLDCWRKDEVEMSRASVSIGYIFKRMKTLIQMLAVLKIPCSSILEAGLKNSDVQIQSISNKNREEYHVMEAIPFNYTI